MSTLHKSTRKYALAAIPLCLALSCNFFKDPKSQNDLKDLGTEEASCLIAQYESGASTTEAIVSCALQTRSNIFDVVKDLFRVYSAKRAKAMAARAHASASASTSASIAPMPSALVPPPSPSK